MEYVKSKLLSQESNPRPCTARLSMASDSYGFIFSGCSSALVKYLSSRTDVQVPRSLFWGREHPDLTLYFTSIQTPASHSLDYSTALPVPYIVTLFGSMTWWLFSLILSHSNAIPRRKEKKVATICFHSICLIWKQPFVLPWSSSHKKEFARWWQNEKESVRASKSASMFVWVSMWE